jgi:hypothetical protein
MCSKYNNHSKLNIQHNCGQPIRPFNELHENLHFDFEYDIQMSFENYEKSGYDLNQDTLTILD